MRTSEVIGIGLRMGKQEGTSTRDHRADLLDTRVKQSSLVNA
jgi:hypothetical protein